MSCPSFALSKAIQSPSANLLPRLALQQPLPLMLYQASSIRTACFSNAPQPQEANSRAKANARAKEAKAKARIKERAKERARARARKGSTPGTILRHPKPSLSSGQAPPLKKKKRKRTSRARKASVQYQRRTRKGNEGISVRISNKREVPH